MSLKNERIQCNIDVIKKAVDALGSDKDLDCLFETAIDRLNEIEQYIHTLENSMDYVLQNSMEKNTNISILNISKA